MSNKEPNQEYPVFDLVEMTRLLEEESYTMPRGLTREQRMEWAKNNLKEINQE